MSDYVRAKIIRYPLDDFYKKMKFDDMFELEELKLRLKEFENQKLLYSFFRFRHTHLSLLSLLYQIQLLSLYDLPLYLVL